MERTLLKRDYLLRIIDATNEGIYVTDTQRRFLVWNRAAERISGYAAEEVLGRACHENILCHTDGEGSRLCLLDCPLSKAIETRTPQGPSLAYLRHKDGRQVPVEVSTAPVFDENEQVIGGVELFHDVTSRLQQQQRITRKKQELEAVLNNIREGILFLDSGGRITLHNRAMADLLGLPQEDLSDVPLSLLPADHGLLEALKESHREFRGPSCWELNKCPEEKSDCPSRRSLHCRCWVMSPHPADGKRSRSCRQCLAHRNARVFLERPKELQLNGRALSVWSSFVDSVDAGDFGEVLVFRDVTKEKDDAVVKCAAGTAHELRQPLQAITSSVALLEAEALPTPRGREYVSVIRESCRRLNEVIKKIGEIAQYRTKHYSDRKDILDIRRSSDHAAGASEPGSAGLPAAGGKC